MTQLIEGAVDPDTAARVTDEVVRESEGLPFLVVAYLDALLGGQAAPVGVGDLLHNRLATLTDGAAQLLATASVIGRSFSFDAVRTASGRSEDEAVVALDELIARGLVDERDAPDGLAYDFTHGQVRTFVYDRTSLARRRLLHHRVAEALLASARPVGDPASTAAAVAHHERQAGHDDLAAEHFRRAGDHARAVYANADALGHYDAALALGHPAVADLHEAIGDLETLEGRFIDAVASYERAAARLGPEDARAPRGEARRRAPAPRPLAGGRGPLRRSSTRPSASTGRSRPERGSRRTWPSPPTAKGAPSERACSPTRRCSSPSRRRTSRPWSTPAPSPVSWPPDGAMAPPPVSSWCAPSTSRTRVGDPAARVAAANALARIERTSGDLGRAEALVVEALEVCVAIGDRHREAALRDLLAQVLHEAGRADDAMEQLKRAVAIFADIGVEGGSIQTEIWRLSEWVDQSSSPLRNDPGTLGRDNAQMVSGPGRRWQG